MDHSDDAPQEDLVTVLQESYTKLPGLLVQLLPRLGEVPLSVQEAHALAQLAETGFFGFQNITTPLVPIGFQGELIPFLSTASETMNAARTFYEQIRMIEYYVSLLPDDLDSEDDYRERRKLEGNRRQIIKKPLPTDSRLISCGDLDEIDEGFTYDNNPKPQPPNNNNVMIDFDDDEDDWYYTDEDGEYDEDDYTDSDSDDDNNEDLKYNTTRPLKVQSETEYRRDLENAIEDFNDSMKELKRAEDRALSLRPIIRDVIQYSTELLTQNLNQQKGVSLNVISQKIAQEYDDKIKAEEAIAKANGDDTQLTQQQIQQQHMLNAEHDPASWENISPYKPDLFYLIDDDSKP